jgi:hypothetical protein
LVRPAGRFGVDGPSPAVFPPQDAEEKLALLLGRSVVLLCMDVRRRRRLLALRSFFCESLLAMVLVWRMERERIYRLPSLRRFRDPDDEHLHCVGMT